MSIVIALPKQLVLAFREFTSHDEGRAPLRCLRIEATERMVSLCATDTHALLYADIPNYLSIGEGKIKVTSRTGITVPQVVRADGIPAGGSVAVTIPVQELSPVLAHGEKGEPLFFHVDPASTQVRIESGGGISVMCDTEEYGPFPPWRRVIHDERGDVTTIAFNPSLISKCAKVQARLNAIMHNDAKLICTFAPVKEHNDKPLHGPIYVTFAQCQYLKALIMPMMA